MPNATHEPAADPSGPAETRWMIFWGTMGVLVWFGLFGLGLFINSAFYREKVGRELDADIFAMSIVTYTPTNVGLICLVAAFIGGCTSRLQAHHAARKRGRKPPRDSASVARKSGQPDASDPSAPATLSPSAAEQNSQSPSESEIYRSENPASSLLRGFLVYGAYLAGSFIVTDTPFSATSPELYARAAGAISLAAFAVGFDRRSCMP